MKHSIIWNPWRPIAFAQFVVGHAQQIPLEAEASTPDHDISHFGKLPFATAELEEYIEDVMERWHAPGMAVAIINGENTWAKVGRYLLAHPKLNTPGGQTRNMGSQC